MLQLSIAMGTWVSLHSYLLWGDLQLHAWGQTHNIATQ